MKTILLLISIFALGFLSANVANYLIAGYEIPFTRAFGINTTSLTAPSDVIAREQIKVFNDKIIIFINDASVSEYAATGSMQPVFNEYSNGIRVTPKSEEDIHVGDIISFEKNGLTIVHRVIEKGIDSQGTYFITKGDNTEIIDGKIRFKDIKYKTIGVLY
jgi:signal peptidase I